MSDDSQNPRSPQQQFDTIQDAVNRGRYPWQHVRSYDDPAITGRLLRKRPGFMQMIRDIETGVLQVDLILVDTFERFGRAEGLAALRRRLYNRHGVLLLTVDSNFTDPTSVAGIALSLIESIRSVEDGRIKAHCVRRGQRDAARLKHWPSGNPPMGYRIQKVPSPRDGQPDATHSILVPSPETAWIMQRLFQLAHETGQGNGRLAKSLNQDPEIPDRYKPFHGPTIGYWLSNPIYVGELVWGEHSTAIVDDSRIKRRNDAEQVLRVGEFCEPLVSREVFNAVQELRRQRGERIRRAREAKKQAQTNGKLIMPLVPGLALKYPLTGLVICGSCGRSMTPSSTGPYVTKSGIERRYVRYTCPGCPSGVCSNNRSVSEPWLREHIFKLIRERLFPTGDKSR